MIFRDFLFYFGRTGHGWNSKINLHLFGKMHKYDYSTALWNCADGLVHIELRWKAVSDPASHDTALWFSDQACCYPQVSTLSTYSIYDPYPLNDFKFKLGNNVTRYHQRTWNLQSHVPIYRACVITHKAWRKITTGPLWSCFTPTVFFIDFRLERGSKTCNNSW
jgi:hypothetical protein